MLSTTPAPASNTSPSAPASVAKQATPQAIASKREIDKPSTKEGKIKTSAALRISIRCASLEI